MDSSRAEKQLIRNQKELLRNLCRTKHNNYIYHIIYKIYLLSRYTKILTEWHKHFDLDTWNFPKQISSGFAADILGTGGVLAMCSNLLDPDNDCSRLLTHHRVWKIFANDSNAGQFRATLPRNIFICLILSSCLYRKWNLIRSWLFT